LNKASPKASLARIVPVYYQRGIGGTSTFWHSELHFIMFATPLAVLLSSLRILYTCSIHGGLYQERLLVEWHVTICRLFTLAAFRRMYQPAHSGTTADLNPTGAVTTEAFAILAYCGHRTGVVYAKTSRGICFEWRLLVLDRIPMQRRHMQVFSLRGMFPRSHQVQVDVYNPSCRCLRWNLKRPSTDYQ
jgi:hypothetical protein